MNESQKPSDNRNQQSRDDLGLHGQTEPSSSVTRGGVSWKNILLICSLLFNLILAGFIIYHLVAKPLPPPPRPPRTEFNKEHFRKKHTEIRQKRLEFMETRKRFMQNLASPEFDETASRKQLEELMQRHSEMERMIAENLIEMRKNMDNEQAKRFFNAIPKKIQERRETLQRRR